MIKSQDFVIILSLAQSYLVQWGTVEKANSP